jgi:hypothetical protein
LRLPVVGQRRRVTAALPVVATVVDQQEGARPVAGQEHRLAGDAEEPGEVARIGEEVGVAFVSSRELREESEERGRAYGDERAVGAKRQGVRRGNEVSVEGVRELEGVSAVDGSRWGGACAMVAAGPDALVGSGDERALARDAAHIRSASFATNSRNWL